MSEYTERDIEAQGEYYTRHVSAMTEEGLHSKSDIAAELAHRDIVIEQLRKAKAELVGVLEKYLGEQEQDMETIISEMLLLVEKYGAGHE